jgi:DNA-binding MarR family transcriptional regulator
VTDNAEREPCQAPPPEPLLAMPSVLMIQMGKLARRLAGEMFPDDVKRSPRGSLGGALVLALLASHGPLSQREVSDRGGMDPGDLVSVIDALEKQGYVVRDRDPKDRRRYALRLTHEGHLALHERRNRAARLNDALFEPLTPLEREMLEGLLLRVLSFHDERFSDLESHATRTWRDVLDDGRQISAPRPDTR